MQLSMTAWDIFIALFDSSDCVTMFHIIIIFVSNIIILL